MWRNGEGYSDPTASAALAHIITEEKRRRRQMAREFAKEFYKSAAWRRTRDAYIQERLRIDGGICEVCGQEPGKVVHHKVWLSAQNLANLDIILNPNNLRYECQTCHNKEKDPSLRGRGRYYFGPNGEIIQAEADKKK